MKKDKIKLEARKEKDSSENCQEKACDKKASPSKDELKQEIAFLRNALERRGIYIDRQYHVINHLTQMINEMTKPTV